MDRSFWQGIVAGNGALPPGHSPGALIPELMDYLGAPDPELRDRFGYTILATWIEQGRCPPETLRWMAGQLQENLQAGLGQAGEPTVYLRSFSALVLAEVVAHDNRQPFLTAPEVRAILQSGLDYLAREQDLRGYVPGEGWAHSCAHSADLLLALAQSRHLGVRELEQILTAIAAKLSNQSGYRYVHDEDERLARAALAAIARGEVPPAFLAGWVERLAQENRRVFQPEDRIEPTGAAYHNTKQFLRSLYFQLARGGAASLAVPGLQAQVAAAVYAIRDLPAGG